MTGDPGDPGEPRTLQDPLAESLRVVDLADRTRAAGSADGRHGRPGPCAGLAGAHPAGRGRPRLRDAGQGSEAPSTSSSPREGYTRGQAPQRAVRRQAGLLRRRAAAAARSTSSSTASRCATASSSPTGSPSRSRRCRSPSCSCRSSRSSRSTARTCSTRSSSSPSIRSAQDDGAPDSRHGHGAINVPRILSFTSNDWGWWRTVDRQPRHARPVPRRGAHAGGPGPQQRARTVLFEPGAQVAALRTAIAEAPKSTRWKLRARVGERQTWYHDPEEMGHN